MTCTSFSMAWRTASAGVWNKGPISTSKAKVGIGRGDYLGTAIMSVLSHLDDQPLRGRRPFFLGKPVNIGLDFLEFFVAFIHGSIHS